MQREDSFIFSLAENNKMLPTLEVSPRLALKADKFEQAMAFFVPGDRDYSRVNTEGSSIVILTLISRSYAIAVLLSCRCRRT